mgnify:CR=1 FL=1
MKICPYLGLLHDPTTPAVFPSERNFCHKVIPPQAILDDHQQVCCLAAGHQDCPVFQSPAPSTREAFFYHPVSSPPQRAGIFPVLFGFLLFAIVLLAGGAYWLSLKRPQALVPIAPTAAALESPSPSPAILATETVSEIVSEPTSTPTLPPPTEMASVTPPAGLETLIGENPGLLIHRVERGESLTSLAIRYNTSAEAIQAVNFVMPLPLWQDWLVVIPVDLQDASGLPRFEVYQVGETDSTLDILSAQQGVDVDLAARYNQLHPTDPLTAGSWLLLPRP